jgi:hypothetical protein
MGTGSGDRLASGRNQKASWGPLEGVSEETFNKAMPRVKKEKKLFCECRDCGRKFYSVTDFSQHVADCPTK